MGFSVRKDIGKNEYVLYIIANTAILGGQKHEYFFRQFRNDLGLVYFVLLNS